MVVAPCLPVMGGVGSLGQQLRETTANMGGGARL